MNFFASFQLQPFWQAARPKRHLPMSPLLFLLLVLATELQPTTAAACASLRGHCNLHNINPTSTISSNSDFGGIRVVPTILGGSRQLEYTCGTTMEEGPDGEAPAAWIKARQKASRDRAYYATLTQDIPAEPYWNRRVMFQGMVGWRGLSRSNNGFGSLVARVVSGYGQTLVLDNMQARPLVGWIYQRQLVSVVLDVPGPHPTASCPDVGTLPAFIHLGLMLSGGVGYMDIRQATLRVVGTDVPITGRPTSL